MDDGADVFLGGELEGAVVKFGALAADGQAEAGAGKVGDIGTALEGGAEAGKVGGWDAEAAVLDPEDGQRAVPLEGHIDGLRGGRELDRVGEQPGQEVAEKIGVAMGQSGKGNGGELDGAAVPGGAGEVVEAAAAGGVEIERNRAEFEASGVDPAEDEDLFHQRGHPPGLVLDRLDVFESVGEGEPVVVAFKDFGGGVDHAERGAEFVGDQGNEVAFEAARIPFAGEAMEDFVLRAPAGDDFAFEALAGVGQFPGTIGDPAFEVPVDFAEVQGGRRIAGIAGVGVASGIGHDRWGGRMEECRHHRVEDQVE